MKKIFTLLLLTILLSFNVTFGEEEVITFPDVNFEQSVRELINKPVGEIYKSDVVGITSIDFSSKEISNIEGIQHFSDLVTLYLSSNQITDISPLSGLSNLSHLYMNNNAINDSSTPSGSYKSELDFTVNGTTYKVWLIENTKNNNLSDLELSIGVLSPSFDKDTLNYTVNINQTTSGAIQITPTVDYINSTVTVNGEVVNSGESSGDVLLTVGDSTFIPIIVTSEDGSTKEYIIEIFEAEAITFPDLNFEQAVRKLIFKPEGEIYTSDVVNITSFYIPSANVINRIDGIEYFTNLKTFSMINNQISDVSPLLELKSLTSLSLMNNQISDISSLSGLVNLTNLGLGSNQINDISPLSGLSNLTHLNVLGNQITDISPLSELTNLKALGIGNEQISDVSILSELTSLETLSLFSTQVNDISPLSLLTNLTWLDLVTNQISDISPISGLINLTHLRISNEPLNDSSTPNAIHKSELDFTVDGITYEVWVVVDSNNANPLVTVNVRDSNGNPYTGDVKWRIFAPNVTSTSNGYSENGVLEFSMSDVPVDRIETITDLLIYPSDASAAYSLKTSLRDKNLYESLDVGVMQFREAVLTGVVLNPDVTTAIGVDVFAKFENGENINVWTSVEGKFAIAPLDKDVSGLVNIYSSDGSGRNFKSVERNVTFDSKGLKIQLVKQPVVTFMVTDENDAPYSGTIGYVIDNGNKRYNNRRTLNGIVEISLDDFNKGSEYTTITIYPFYFDGSSANSLKIDIHNFDFSKPVNLGKIMFQEATLTGKVVYPNGEVAYGVDVIATFENGETLRVMPNRDGEYKLAPMDLKYTGNVTVKARDYINRLESKEQNVSYDKKDLTITLDGTILTNLEISEGTLAPKFDKDTLSYKVYINQTSSGVIKITPTVGYINATVTVNGQVVKSGDESSEITLKTQGSTLIAIVVTTEDGSSKEYIIEVVEDEVIDFPDANFEQAVRELISKPEGEILKEDLVGITNIDISNKNISNFEGVQYFTELKSLSMGDWILADISMISELSKLTNLSLFSSQEIDISILSRLTNLTSLTLRFYESQIVDISILEELTNLTNLSLALYNADGTDISPLSNLTNLESLNLTVLGLEDISSISELVNLERLILGSEGFNQISDISSLTKLTKLAYLDLYSNEISDISSLSNLMNIERLFLSNNEITDISLLSELTNLTELWLNNNPINDSSTPNVIHKSELDFTVDGTTYEVWVVDNTPVTPPSPSGGGSSSSGGGYIPPPIVVPEVVEIPEIKGTEAMVEGIVKDGKSEVTFSTENLGNVKSIIVESDIATIEIPVGLINKFKVVRLEITTEVELNEAQKEIVENSVVYDFNLYNNGEKSSKFSSALTVKVPYELQLGENPKFVTVFYINEDNEIENMKGSYFDGEVTFKTNHFSKYFVKENIVTFIDTTDAKVIELASKGIISGMGEGNFDPDGYLTRAELATLLVNALSLEVDLSTTEAFTDVKSDAWYYEYVMTARALGIISGIGNNEFDPEAKVKTQDAMIMISKCMENFKGVMNNSVVVEFENADEYANKFISHLVELDFVTEDFSTGIESIDRLYMADLIHSLYFFGK